MNRRIQITNIAANDLAEIWGYIAIENQSPEAADRLIDEIDDRLRVLAKFPSSGEPASEFRAGTRRVIFRKRFLLFYEPHPDSILVLRVLHGARLFNSQDFSALS